MNERQAFLNKQASYARIKAMIRPTHRDNLQPPPAHVPPRRKLRAKARLQ